MSHQMKVQAQIKSLNSLKAALTELGYNYEENGILVDYRDNKIGAIDVLVTAGGKTNRIGFKWDETAKEYELVGDFYQLSESQTNFQNSVKQLYVKAEIATGLKKHRFSVMQSKKQTDGSIVMRVRSRAA